MFLGFHFATHCTALPNLTWSCVIKDFRKAPSRTHNKYVFLRWCLICLKRIFENMLRTSQLNAQLRIELVSSGSRILGYKMFPNLHKSQLKVLDTSQSYGKMVFTQLFDLFFLSQTEQNQIQQRSKFIARKKSH